MVLPEGTSGLLMVGGIALASYLLLRGSRAAWARSKRKDDAKEIRKLLPERDRDSALADAPPEVLRWHVELHETARDLKAEIDTKLAALNALTIIAREQADRLEQLLAEAKKAQTDDGDPSR